MFHAAASTPNSNALRFVARAPQSSLLSLDQGRGSVESTQGGALFFRERLLLLCKVIAAIDVLYYALFTLALSFDSSASFWSLLGQSFSQETLGEYVLLAAIWAVCRIRSSPELIAAPDKVDARSDIYALGAVAYFLLTGLPLFESKTTLHVCTDHLFTEPVLPSERTARALPKDLERVVMRCLSKDPAARHPDVKSLAVALGACGDAGKWSEQDAIAWWAEHQASLDAARVAVRANASPTLAVDLTMRARCTSAARSG